MLFKFFWWSGWIPEHCITVFMLFRFYEFSRPYRVIFRLLLLIFPYLLWIVEIVESWDVNNCETDARSCQRYGILFVPALVFLLIRIGGISCWACFILLVALQTDLLFRYCFTVKYFILMLSTSTYPVMALVLRAKYSLSEW